MAGDPPRLHDHDSAEGLISVDEARARVLDAIQPSRRCSSRSPRHGCVSAEDVVAAESLPAFASSAMDGFAVRASDVAEARPGSPAELKIVGRAMIGSRPEAVVGGGEAVAIATELRSPRGPTRSCRSRTLEVQGEVVRLIERGPAARHVRPVGEDVAEGTVLVERGRRLRARARPAGERGPSTARASASSRGRAQHRRRADPADRNAGVRPDPRLQRVHAVRRAPRGGRDAGTRRHREGRRRPLKETVFDFLIQADAFISSGGVSVGERDVVKARSSVAGTSTSLRRCSRACSGLRPHRGEAVLLACRGTRSACS